MPWETSIFQSSHLPALHCFVLIFAFFGFWRQHPPAFPRYLLRTWAHGPFPHHGPVVKAYCMRAFDHFPMLMQLPIWHRYHCFSKKCLGVPTFIAENMYFMLEKRSWLVSALFSIGGDQERHRQKSSICSCTIFPLPSSLSHLAPSLFPLHLFAPPVSPFPPLSLHSDKGRQTMKQVSPPGAPRDVCEDGWNSVGEVTVKTRRCA